MKNKKVLFLTQAALIAALYVILTEVSNIFGLASLMIQVRFSETLTILPFFTPAAIPGLFVGCIISNLLVSANIFDIIFGSMATLIGGILTYYIGKYNKKAVWFAPIPPIVANTVIIPFVLKYAYGFEPISLSFLTIFIGEFISCGILGMPLLFVLKKYARHIFTSQD